jgi:hypothetical protein
MRALHLSTNAKQSERNPFCGRVDFPKFLIRRRRLFPHRRSGCRETMRQIETTSIVLVCTFCGSLGGILLRGVLPRAHLSSATNDLIKLGMGIVGTMTALVLGLMISSARASFDSKSKELTDMSVNVVLLDRSLAFYGPETAAIRGLVRDGVAAAVDQTWSRSGSRSLQGDPVWSGREVIYDKILALSPKTDGERSLQSQALGLAVDVAKARWLLFDQGSDYISTPELVVVVFWLTILFISFGLNAPSNPTVLTVLFVCSVAVSGAIWLILGMYTPFEGLMQISDAPMRAALLHLGR